MDNNKVVVKVIGTFKLQLKTEFYFDFFETFVAPSSKQNLISISCLDKSIFSYSFGNKKISLYKNSNFIDFGSLVDNLLMLHVISSYNNILQTSSRGSKKKLSDNSTTL